MQELDLLTAILHRIDFLIGVVVLVLGCYIAKLLIWDLFLKYV